MLDHYSLQTHGPAGVRKLRLLHADASDPIRGLRTLLARALQNRGRNHDKRSHRNDLGPGDPRLGEGAGGREVHVGD